MTTNTINSKKTYQHHTPRKMIYKGKEVVTVKMVRQLLRLGTPINSISKNMGIPYINVYCLKRNDEAKGIKYKQSSNMRTKAANKHVEIVNYLQSGLTLTEISKKMKMSVPATRYHLKKEGLTIKKTVDKEEVLKLYNDGMKVGQIAKELGVTYSKVAYCLQKVKLDEAYKNNISLRQLQKENIDKVD